MRALVLNNPEKQWPRRTQLPSLDVEELAWAP